MDPVPEGLRTLLNEIRETAIEDNTLYGRSVERIDPTTPIAAWAAPILNNPEVFNEFVPSLIKRIAQTQVEIQYFNSPLRELEGTDMPLGSSIQDIFINPAEGRQFNPNDFAGLLCKYEADVKVQYNTVNAHWQYPMTVSYDNVRDAFVSWDSLYRFIDAQAAAMYNGFYIDDFNTTKGLIAAAYRENMVRVNVITKPTDEATAKAMIMQARAMYLNMQLPSTEFNAWNQIGGAGRAIKTFTRPEDIVVLIRNDILALVDVEVLAAAFNMDRTTLMGRIYGVDSFDQYDSEGNKVYDGENIYFAIGDRRWFRIKPQMMRFDQFYNANNTTWNWYLRVEKMYQYSYFANMVVYAGEAPAIEATGVAFANTTATVNAGQSVTVTAATTPAQATDAITYNVTSGTATDLTLTTTNNGRQLKITAKSTASGAYTIQATANGQTSDLALTVNPVAALAAAAPVKVATKSTKASE